MNDFDSLEEPVLLSPEPKKRGRTLDNHAREKRKKLRYCAGGKVPKLGCHHTARANAKLCHADLLTPDDLALNHDKFYETPSKVVQDQCILNLIDVCTPQRRRIRVANEEVQKDRNVCVKYFLLTVDHPRKIRVCKATFLKVLGISKDRVSRVARYYAENAKACPENRGGLRNADQVEARRQRVVDHIQTFTCKASHYGRRGALGRKYLPSDLSVKKMYEYFEAQNHEHVSYSLYYSVFVHKFNLGFGHPATDACATCAKFKLGIKDPSLTEEEKRHKTAMFILHRRRARVFYDILGQSVQGCVTVCFDMMQNMALPRTPIGQAYYSRQLYLYLFGVVVHHGKDSNQTKNDVYLYTWMEHQNKKDSNMIASALDDCFRVKLNGMIRASRKLRLFSDSCFGQNKNMNVICMLMSLRKTAFLNLDVEYTFPIRGHSFLPADRVFGRIEQDIRKQDTIMHPQGYLEILRKHGNVIIYGEDWNALDFKSETQAFVKAQRSFKLSDARMLSLTSDKIGFKTTYAADYCYHSVLKRGKTWVKFRPGPLEMVSTVKDAKRRDVENLLNEIGAPDNIMEFYNNALSADAMECAQESDADSDEGDSAEY